MKTLNTLKMVCVLAMIGAAAANTASADTITSAAPQMVVHYSDLNLNSKQGVATLYSRIQRAAAAVCAPGIDSYNAVKNPIIVACQQQSVDRAVAVVSSTSLQKLHFAKTGRSVQPIQVATVR